MECVQLGGRDYLQGPINPVIKVKVTRRCCLISCRGKFEDSSLPCPLRLAFFGFIIKLSKIL